MARLHIAPGGDASCHVVPIKSCASPSAGTIRLDFDLRIR
jgi:hypothetical protein